MEDINKVQEKVTEFHNLVDELKTELNNNSFINIFSDFFGLDNLNKWIDQLSKDVDNRYELYKQEKESEQKKQEPEFIRPSSKVDTERGLQLHKLVQEYIDTMVKPYNHGKLTTEQINDVYAGLYEFACWIINK